MAQNQTRSIKSGGSKRDFTDGLILVATFELGLEDQVHSVEDGERGKGILGGENSMSNGLEQPWAVPAGRIRPV